MRLKRLEICGFKSFPDKTAIDFPNGVSAIVGPNGCGKSNIVDAICWVTGEQSVKQLRGKSMEDVIFAGANGRPPVNQAEVSITFANNNGSAPEEYRDYSEIQVTRRLYRSGESGYFINKRPCRLKDIGHLLAGSGVGARTYSVVQQGNIGALTEAGPEERRFYIEEAAGVTRYKARKKEALSKIEATRQNLLRVMDIISEVERSMASTKRQANKAERYKDFQEKIRQLEVGLAGYDFDRFGREIRELEELITSLSDQEISHASRQTMLDARIEEIREKKETLAETLSALEADLHSQVRRTDQMENDLKHAKEESVRLREEAEALGRERADLEGKLSRLAEEKAQAEEELKSTEARLADIKESLHAEKAEAEEVQSRLSSLQEVLEGHKTRYMELVTDEARYNTNLQNADTNKRQIARQIRLKSEEAAQAEARTRRARRALDEAAQAISGLNEESAAIEDEVKTTEAELEKSRIELKAMIASVHAAEIEHGKTKTALNTLRRMEGNYEWYNEGVRTILKARDKGEGQALGSGVVGLVAEMLEPAPGFEKAVEAALGPALEYVVVETPASGVAAIDHLSMEKAGRAGFVPLPWTGNGAAPKEPPAGSLLDHVKVLNGHGSLVRELLKNVIVAEDRGKALALKESGVNGHTVVTRDGRLILTPHAMIGGESGAKKPGILEQKSRIRELDEELARLEADLARDKKAKTDLEAKVRELESSLQKHVEALRVIKTRELEAQKALYRAEEEEKQAARHLEIVVLERDQLQGDEDDAERELTKYQRLIAEVKRDVDEAKKAVEDATRSIQEVEKKLESYKERTTEKKLEENRLTANRDHLTGDLKKLALYEQDEASRKTQLAYDIQRKNRLADEAAGRITTLEAGLGEGYEALDRKKAALSEKKDRYEELAAELAQSESAKAEVADHREAAARKLREIELTKTQKSIRQEGVANRILERYGQPMDILRNEEDIPEFVDADQEAQARGDLESLKIKVERMGDVNLGAIAEYEALSERFEFLCRQRDDLNQAIESLKKVISKINRYTQRRFLETFEKVDEKIQEVFPRLFSGGSARLVLTDPDNPLETGVEYHVHPPGKKLTRMSLLSGGEKALSAIAFVFSIFLLKPASFCLMDEVDAPLDDSNVFRFNQLLKIIGEKSQVIMITHNKSAMEFADMLFGITMERRGVSKVVSVNLERHQQECA